MTGALVYSACNEMARAAAKAAGRNYHAEKLAAERERMRVYYIALYADMERARVARVPLMIGIDLGYGIPAGVQEQPQPAGWHVSFDHGATWEYHAVDPWGQLGERAAIVRPLVYGDGADWRTTGVATDGGQR